MKIRNPNYAERIRQVFRQAAFVQAVGIEIVDLGVGWVETAVEIRSDFHLQQHGFIHAGVQATLADHTAGAAAATLLAANQNVLTVEFKINLLRPAQGDRLTCRADVLKAGRTLTVVEAVVTCWQGDSPRIVSKITATIANVST